MRKNRSRSRGKRRSVKKDNIRQVPKNIKKNFREGSKFKPWGNRPVKLTKADKVLEYGNAGYNFVDGVYGGATGRTEPTKPGSYNKQRYKVIVVSSAMSGITNDLVNKSKVISENFSDEEYDVLVSSGEQVSCSLIALLMGFLASWYAAFRLEKSSSNEGLVTTRSFTKKICPAFSSSDNELATSRSISLHSTSLAS